MTRRRSHSSSSSRARRRRSSAATARTARRVQGGRRYVSNFAPQITRIASDKALIAAWKKDEPGQVARLLRPADLRRRAGRPDGDQGRLRQGQGLHRQARRRDPERQEDQDPQRKWILGGAFAWSKVNTQRPDIRRSSTSCRSSPTARTRSSTSRVLHVLGSRAVRRDAGPPSRRLDSPRRHGLGHLHSADAQRADRGQHVRAHRPRLHARVRRPEALELRSRRRLHGRLVHRLRRPQGARRRRATRPSRCGFCSR